jgi:phage terminase small subunit
MSKVDEATDKPLTPKQEAFALAYFETGNAAEAYRRAYNTDENARDNWVYVEASQLLDHPKVSLRIQELQQHAQALSMFSRMEALKEYEEARVLAAKVGNPSAMVSATTGKAKLFGLEAPARARMEHTGKDGKDLPQQQVTIFQLPDNGRG